MFSGIYAFGQESAPPAPAPSPAPNITPCMHMQKWADKIIQTANSFDKPSLKNPAIEKHVLKAMEYVQSCNLEHALKNLDVLDAILNQPKYDGILNGPATELRSWLIACYNYHCTIKE
ncbi:MAG: hypothetical protein CVU00_07265 [Bacteroidetes bacterium HGW-Bacteroidetes-17]|nr:MAG: hypothetical protein CVU00_07265 [Bacteroidetes bacterium HGW-Bacteroidetes-17]